MCGICGIINLDKVPVDQSTLSHMSEAIMHRGPDSEGIYTDEYVGLGHRRLAVIDLSADANQPMSAGNEAYTIVYNGEIYNFKELRDELTKLGHQFNSQSDTEVILKSYMAWGAECINRFNGMFAFAIWDKTKKHLFIARDRYGIKPLYYTFVGNTFLFASEQKALLKHPGVKREIDLETLPEYFTFQNILTDRTLLKGISLFPAGNYAILSVRNNINSLHPVSYWDYDFIEPDSQISEQEYLEELDRLFKQAVTRQLVSDVELGCYLSGGMDSGSITAIAAQVLPYIKTFTCGFDLHSATGLELAFDEREKSEYMSYLFKTEHYEMVLKAGDMERVLPELTWHLEEPRVGQSYPNYYVSQLASKFVKVVMAGTGGDEIFGGYPWRYYRAVVNDSFESYVDKYYLFWQRLIPDELTSTVFKPIHNEVKHVQTREIFRDVFAKHASKLTRPEDYINHSLYFEAKTFLHGLLIVEDKLSMAHGLENRVPFLDNDLVDFVMKLTVKYKLGNLGEIVRLNENEAGPKTKKYFNKTKDGKLLLRKAMSKYIPNDISDATKQGFSAPDASWFKGESIDYVKNKLYAKDAIIYDFMDRNTVTGLINEHLEGKQNRRLLIWSLLNFEQWCNTFLH
jgi:asparagine synthase (glutamine-hydrolysing)